MYIPVMHARRSEKNAVLAVSGDPAVLRPLFVPVVYSSANETVRFMSKHKVPFFCLTTPVAPKAQVTQTQALALLKGFDTDLMATPVVAVTATKPMATLAAEIAALPADRDIAVLHMSESESPKLDSVLDQKGDQIKWHFFRADACSSTYWDRWKSKLRGILEEGFIRQPTNADYAKNLDEVYSRLPYRYKPIP